MMLTAQPARKERKTSLIMMSMKKAYSWLRSKIKRSSTSSSLETTGDLASMFPTESTLPSLSDVSCETYLKMPDSAEKAHLTGLFFDALETEDGAVRREKIAEIEAGTLRIKRISLILQAYKEHASPKLGEILQNEGYDLNNTDRIASRLKSDGIRIQMLKDSMSNEAGAAIDANWFSTMCKHFSDLNKYRISHRDITLLDFTNYYKDLIEWQQKKK